MVSTFILLGNVFFFEEPTFLCKNRPGGICLTEEEGIILIIKGCKNGAIISLYRTSIVTDF